MLNDVNIFLFQNHKGGVSKSTSSYIFSNLLATDSHPKVLPVRKGERTLVVDLDFQTNVSISLLKERYDEIEGGVLEALADGDATPYVQQINENLFVLPALDNIATFDEIFIRELSDIENSTKLLENAIASFVEEFDIKNVVIDTAPSLNKLLFQGLNICFEDRPTNVIIPFPLDSYGKRSIQQSVETLSSVMENSNPNINVIGLVPVLLDINTSLDNQILEEIREIYGDSLLDVALLRRADIKKMKETGFSEKYSKEREVLSMYYDLYEKVKERI